jgi:hypothetical protein
VAVRYSDYRIGDEPPTLEERVLDALDRMGFVPGDDLYNVIATRIESADLEFSGDKGDAYESIFDACEHGDIDYLMDVIGEHLGWACDENVACDGDETEDRPDPLAPCKACQAALEDGPQQANY